MEDTEDTENDEIRMTNEIRNSNDQMTKQRLRQSCIRFVIRASVIRH